MQRHMKTLVFMLLLLFSYKLLTSPIQSFSLDYGRRKRTYISHHSKETYNRIISLDMIFNVIFVCENKRLLLPHIRNRKQQQGMVLSARGAWRRSINWPVCRHFVLTRSHTTSQPFADKYPQGTFLS